MKSVEDALHAAVAGARRRHGLLHAEGAQGRSGPRDARRLSTAAVPAVSVGVRSATTSRWQGDGAGRGGGSRQPLHGPGEVDEQVARLGGLKAQRHDALTPCRRSLELSHVSVSGVTRATVCDGSGSYPCQRTIWRCHQRLVAHRDVLEGRRTPRPVPGCRCSLGEVRTATGCGQRHRALGLHVGRAVVQRARRPRRAARGARAGRCCRTCHR